ncbi:queuine tRNA-ribosyltransferase [Thermosporothrix hazakensis]|jgi:queuine tRNA-ribosyltransferase|uniref:Queuine tRNA-ribosyltransferase n=2 Tax=Thermosporothrix TaxID=768650 RepID=A0A326U8F2_THEHA|nr:tRNA guanosine(34) transglycosylase Tgt [Thermosporothrix hazakensis]PZW22592.1 queuine tRNA-ribosyltransferase [Thermosporothrix hazakensis]BBH90513.1 tRNA-guanine transglycosylase [Thermosporothrix sp. COM3]GCE48564.1 tRNA-guanine transglycosylase [Thermosporothrix hazakensis]
MHASKEQKHTENGARTLQLPHGLLKLPVYLPDATLGVVRAVDSTDLEQCGVQALVMNTYHLMQRPGSSTIQALGGLHTMSAWEHPIITDSGGFQAYSLIQQNARFGTLDADGITFKPEGATRKFQLTPEKAVQLQFSYGSDIVMCLDYCTHVDAPDDVQRLSVMRTIEWAKRCKREYERLLKQKKLAEEKRPLLFAVIQGGGSRELRKQCAEALLDIGFDGFGYGGWPLDKQGRLLADIIRYTRELIPAQYPMHALGVGHPSNVAECVQIGYEIFDSAMPTRDARHGRLYCFQDSAQEKWFQYIYVGDDKHIKNKRPVSEVCDCLCCRHYSLGYLHHLFKVGDTLYYRLATLHNLRFMTMLTERLRAHYVHN